MSDRLADVPALLHYDAVVDWEARLEREIPFLERTLADAPSSRILDLGCGTGEHLRALARAGWSAVGIEGVPARWERARQEAPDGAAVFPGDLGAVEAMVRGQFGAAICLGNTLPFLLGAEALSRMLVGLRRRLLPGGLVVSDQLNFDRMPRPGEVVLPERRMDGGGHEDDLVFLRRLDLREDGVVQVTETVHRGDSGAPAVHRRHLAWQGWRSDELRTLLETARFRDLRLLDGFSDAPFDPETSSTLCVVAG